MYLNIDLISLFLVGMFAYFLSFILSLKICMEEM